MQRILFIFFLMICAALQAGEDSTNFNDFQKKVRFYLKYGTRQETSETLHELEKSKQHKTQELGTINNALSQETNNYINASNKSKIVSHSYEEAVQSLQAHQDMGIAWWNWQRINNNKNIAEYELTQIDTLQQAMNTRLNRLNLRKQTYQLTDQQEQLRQAQILSLATASKKNKDAYINESFKQAKKEAEPLLNRMIKQSRKTPPHINLDQYIAAAKTQTQRDEVKKLRKAEAKKHTEEIAQQKLTQRQADLLIQQQELIKQRNEKLQKLHQEQQELAALQACAIIKGSSQKITRPTEAERTAQSIKDKQTAELAKNLVAQSPSKDCQHVTRNSQMKKPLHPTLALPKDNGKQSSTHPEWSPEAPLTPMQNLQNSVTDVLSGMEFTNKIDFETIDNKHNSIFQAVIQLEEKIDQDKQLFYANSPFFITLRNNTAKALHDIYNAHGTAIEKIDAQAKQYGSLVAENSKEIQSLQQRKKSGYQLTKKEESRLAILLNLQKSIFELGNKKIYWTNMQALASRLQEKIITPSDTCGTIKKEILAVLPQKK